jgi:PAS domain-containing protein
MAPTLQARRRPSGAGAGAADARHQTVRKRPPPLKQISRKADHRFMAIQASGSVAITDLIDQLGDAVVAADLDGAITAFNAAAEELYGYAAEEMIGRDIGMLAPAELAE